MKPLSERFWNKVQKSDGCWLWTGSTSGNGYGKIGLGGRGAGYEDAHRTSYRLNVGDIPDDTWVLHTCDIRKCVRPDHLFLGTASDNNWDMFHKGRNRPNPRRGTDSHWAKVTVDVVSKALSLHKDGVDYKEIAARLGIGVSHAWAITRRKCWKWVSL